MKLSARPDVIPALPRELDWAVFTSAGACFSVPMTRIPTFRRRYAIEKFGNSFANCLRAAKTTVYEADVPS